jgi:hypothetical protein
MKALKTTLVWILGWLITAGAFYGLYKIPTKWLIYGAFGTVFLILILYILGKTWLLVNDILHGPK